MLKRYGNTRSSTLIKRLSLLLGVLLVVCASTVAQEESGQSAQGVQPSVESQELENVDVVGYRRGHFRRELVRAEDAFFNLMNTLVIDDDFKVICKARKIKAFSRLTARTCEANFVSRITDETTQRNFNMSSPGNMLDGRPISSTHEVQQKIRERNREQLEVMVKLINENPKLLAAYQELETAKRLLKESKQK